MRTFMYLSPTHIHTHTHSHTLTVTLPGSVVPLRHLAAPPGCCMESVGGPERCAVLLHLLSLFAGCESERREQYTEQSDGSQAEKAGERHRDTQRERERARGLFCCERSESPAGGAALTICQWSHALFFLFFFFFPQ